MSKDRGNRTHDNRKPIEISNCSFVGNYCLYELSVGDYDIILNNTMLGNVPLSLLDTPIVIPFHPTFNVTESITPCDLQTKNTFLVATDP